MRARVVARSCFPRSLSIFAIAVVLAGCAEPEKPKARAVSVEAPRAGSQFDQVGKVSLYPGESCTSQIMFIFHGAGATSISMAAPMRQSKVLTDAVHDHRTVRVLGKWRRGKAAGCYYVEATRVEPQKSFW